MKPNWAILSPMCKSRFHITPLKLARGLLIDPLNGFQVINMEHRCEDLKIVGLKCLNAGSECCGPKVNLSNSSPKCLLLLVGSIFFVHLISSCILHFANMRLQQSVGVFQVKWSKQFSQPQISSSLSLSKISLPSTRNHTNNKFVQLSPLSFT